jgi:hypothetical protein
MVAGPVDSTSSTSRNRNVLAKSLKNFSQGVAPSSSIFKHRDPAFLSFIRCLQRRCNRCFLRTIFRQRNRPPTVEYHLPALTQTPTRNNTSTTTTPAGAGVLQIPRTTCHISVPRKESKSNGLEQGVPRFEVKELFRNK